MLLRYLDVASTDPAYNLALEQYLSENLPDGDGCFLLWRNRGSVIIGRHQNTLAEINEPFVREKKLDVVRRISGGGAVYHDLGNLNYTWILPSAQAKQLEFGWFCRLILDTLRDFGVTAEVTGRNDITVDGKKFSGNAQHVGERQLIHHGTLLIDADLDAMEQALKVEPDKVRGKGIKSVRSRVANLGVFLPAGVGLAELRAALLSRVLGTYGGAAPLRLSEQELEDVERLCRERYRSWSWNYGMSPPCTVKKRRRIEGCGTIEAFLMLERGVISQLALRGDFFSCGDLEVLCGRFAGCPAREEAYSAVLDSLRAADYIRGLDNGQFLALLCGEP